MLVVVQQVIVQRDQSLDGLLYRGQLHQRHLPVLPGSDIIKHSMRAWRDWFPELMSYQLCKHDRYARLPK